MANHESHLDQRGYSHDAEFGLSQVKESDRSVEDLFVLLQNVESDWVSLGTTKTGAVYRLNGNPPQNHE